MPLVDNIMMTDEDAARYSELNKIVERYDRRQYLYKIKLNSAYGSLVNRYFRFYDLRLGESTTGTGRMILKHQCASVNEAITGKYDTYGENIIYGDTDSTYFNIPGSKRKNIIKLATSVGEYVNDSFQEFMQRKFLCITGYDDLIKSEMELISDKGIFVDKKRYILHVTYSEGYDVDKLKVMGLETKKTTLSKLISKKLNGFIEDLLKDKDWASIADEIVAYKDNLINTPNIMDIGLPKGIKGIEDYTQRYELNGDSERLPGHVAAGIFYNKLRGHYNDKVSPPIMSGMKIKVFYLNKKYGKFKSIAIPTDIEVLPQWFLDNFVVDKEAHIMRLVDKPLGNILKAINKEVPSKQTLLANSVFEF